MSGYTHLVAAITATERDILINRLDRLWQSIQRMPPGKERERLSQQREQLLTSVSAWLLERQRPAPTLSVRLAMSA